MALLRDFAGCLATRRKLWMLPLWLLVLALRLFLRGARHEQPSAFIYSLY